MKLEPVQQIGCVVARVLPSVLTKAALTVARGGTLYAQPLAAFCGSDVTLAIHSFMEQKPEPQLNQRANELVSFRRALVEPEPVEGRCISSLSPWSGWLELLLCPDGRLWASYWGADGDSARVTEVRTFPGRTINTPVGIELHSRAKDLPRTMAGFVDLRKAESFVAGHIGIVGLGRMGSLVLDGFAAHGVRRFTTVDPDIVEKSNLDGSSLVTEADVGSAKATSSARAICARFPDALVTVVNAEFPTQMAIDALARCDILVTSVDRDRPRLSINRLSRMMLQLHLDVGTASDPGGGFGADIRLLPPTGACMLCLGGVRDLREDAPRRPGVSSGAINASAANLACDLLLQSARGQLEGSVWVRLRHRGVPTGLTSEVIPNPTRQPDCPWCSSIQAAH